MSRITDSTRRHIIPSRTGITLFVEQSMLNMEQCMLNMEQCMLVAQANMLLFSEICSIKAFFFNDAFLMLQKADYAKRNASIMGLSLLVCRGRFSNLCVARQKTGGCPYRTIPLRKALSARCFETADLFRTGTIPTTVLWRCRAWKSGLGL